LLLPMITLAPKINSARSHEDAWGSGVTAPCNVHLGTRRSEWSVSQLSRSNTGERWPVLSLRSLHAVSCSDYTASNGRIITKRGPISSKNTRRISQISRSLS
jgi:hypothetical protein